MLLSFEGQVLLHHRRVRSQEGLIAAVIGPILPKYRRPSVAPGPVSPAAYCWHATCHGVTYRRSGLPPYSQTGEMQGVNSFAQRSSQAVVATTIKLAPMSANGHPHRGRTETSQGQNAALMESARACFWDRTVRVCGDREIWDAAQIVVHDGVSAASMAMSVPDAPAGDPNPMRPMRAHR